MEGGGSIADIIHLTCSGSIINLYIRRSVHGTVYIGEAEAVSVAYPGLWGGGPAIGVAGPLVSGVI